MEIDPAILAWSLYQWIVKVFWIAVGIRLAIYAAKGLKWLWSFDRTLN